MNAFIRRASKNPLVKGQFFMFDHLTSVFYNIAALFKCLGRI